MTDRADLSDEELIATAIAGALLDVHTALPGIVVAYYPKTGAVDVQPAVKRAIEREDGSTAFESLPVIPNVRVCWPGAGGFEMRFPLKGSTMVGETRIPGDSVWLMFAEADMQKWETSGQESQPGWLARHGLGSLVAYPFSRLMPGSADPSVANLPQMVAPEPFHVGDPTSAKLLAQAEKVDTRLNALKSAIAGWVPVPSDGGAALKAALGSWLAGTADTGCTKLKAE
jgi:hypothetical protein